MVDGRINDIKTKLIPIVGAGFSEYCGNRIARLIKKNGDGYVLDWCINDNPKPPLWFNEHAYGARSEVLTRKFDNKKFYVFIIFGD